jgi:hypothetical protein
MHKNKLIGVAIAAIAGLVLYFVNKRKRSTKRMQQVPVSRTRHLVSAFSKAKHRHGDL